MWHPHSRSSREWTDSSASQILGQIKRWHEMCFNHTTQIWMPVKSQKSQMWPHATAVMLWHTNAGVFRQNRVYVTKVSPFTFRFLSAIGPCAHSYSKTLFKMLNRKEKKPERKSHSGYLSAFSTPTQWSRPDHRRWPSEHLRDRPWDISPRLTWWPLCCSRKTRGRSPPGCRYCWSRSIHCPPSSTSLWSLRRDSRGQGNS